MVAILQLCIANRQANARANAINELQSIIYLSARIMFRMWQLSPLDVGEDNTKLVPKKLN